MAEEIVRTLNTVIDRRIGKLAEVEKSRVQGRNNDGTLTLRPQNGECELTGTISGDPSGSIIISQKAQWNIHGATGAVGSSTSADTLWVESLDPDTYAAGSSYTVTVTGRGFTSGLLFAFLDPDDRLESLHITITSSTFVSSTEFTLEIDVDAAAPVVDSVPLWYGYDIEEVER